MGEPLFHNALFWGVTARVLRRTMPPVDGCGAQKILLWIFRLGPGRATLSR